MSLRPSLRLACQAQKMQPGPTSRVMASLTALRASRDVDAAAARQTKRYKAIGDRIASGGRAPDEPLPAVDGHPKHDFSKIVAQHTAKSLRVAARQDAVDLQLIPEQAPLAPSGPPNACGTCIYLRGKPSTYTDYQCAAYLKDISVARYHDRLCNDGAGWRPRQPGFWSRLLNRFR
jgi:hypothetical protein